MFPLVYSKNKKENSNGIGKRCVKKFARFLADNVGDIKKYIDEHQEEYEQFIKEE